MYGVVRSILIVTQLLIKKKIFTNWELIDVIK